MQGEPSSENSSVEPFFQKQVKVSQCSGVGLNQEKKKTRSGEVTKSFTGLKQVIQVIAAPFKSY